MQEIKSLTKAIICTMFLCENVLIHILITQLSQQRGIQYTHTIGYKKEHVH